MNDNNNLVRLRSITIEDTENIVRWRNNPNVLHNFIDRRPIDAKTHTAWFENFVQTGRVAQFIIVRTDTMQDVGSTFLRDIDRENGTCEYGIFIGEDDARGKGVGLSACKACLLYAFETLKMERVFLRVFSDNIGAIKSYQNAGFVVEGCLRKHVVRDAKRCDITLMGILKDEFEQRYRK